MLLNSALTASPRCKPLPGEISVQSIPHGPVYPAGFAGYFKLDVKDMNSSRIAVAVLAVVGAGAGALAAHFAGVTSWLDAKAYMAVGLVGGVLASKLLQWALK